MINLNLDEILNKQDVDNFPIELFPEQVTDYMNELRDKMGCNPNFMGAAFLSVCSMSIGRSKAIILKNSWREWCMLWNVIIGDAGSKKSPSTSPMFAPLKQIERDNYKLFKAQSEAFSEDVTTTKKKCKRIYTSDSTIEKYIQMGSENPAGMGIVMGEIAGLINSSGKYSGGKGSDIEKYLQAFSYEDLSYDRKVAESARLPNAHLTIFGGIQPTVLTQHMTQHMQDNGFWDRFLFTNGNSKTGYITKSDISEEISNTYNSFVTGLYETIQSSFSQFDDEEIPVDFYRMDKEAFDCWFNYNHEIEKLIAPDSELISREKSAYSKMATYFGRFILLFHILDECYNHHLGTLKSSSTEVKIESVEKAIKLLKYFIHQYELVSKEVSDQKESKNILEDTKGMSIKEKVQLIHNKDPTLSQRAIAKVFGISVGSVSNYLKTV